MTTCTVATISRVPLSRKSGAVHKFHGEGGLEDGGSACF